MVRSSSSVEDILAAASRLAASEIARLREGLQHLEQERAAPPAKRTKK